MQEKKNKRLLISLAILVLAIASFWFFSSKQTNSVLVEPTLFKPEDATKIDHITLASANGKISLDLNGTHWTINNKYDADGQLIKLLFATLDKAEPKRPVSNNQLDSVNAWLSKTGVEVKLYEGENIIASFRAGGNSQKTEAYFQKSAGLIPYVMSIPGYRLYVSYILELDENGWRDKRIFNFNWRNFKSLQMIVPSDPTQNFEVSFKDQFFGINGITSVDTTKLNDYLDAVSLLTAEQFIMPGFSKVYDSLFNTKPAFRLEVTDISAKTFSLDLFVPIKNDPNLVGRLDDNQSILFNRTNILPIAVKKAFFIAR